MATESIGICVNIRVCPYIPMKYFFYQDLRYVNDT